MNPFSAAHLKYIPAHAQRDAPSGGAVIMLSTSSGKCVA